MSNVLEELCKKHDVSRSASYMDQVLDDMLEAPSTSILCKRTKDEMYIKMITQDEEPALGNNKIRVNMSYVIADQNALADNVDITLNNPESLNAYNFK